jgi:hypothetical protein
MSVFWIVSFKPDFESIIINNVNLPGAEQPVTTLMRRQAGLEFALFF